MSTSAVRKPYKALNTFLKRINKYFYRVMIHISFMTMSFSLLKKSKNEKKTDILINKDYNLMSSQMISSNMIESNTWKVKLIFSL